MTRTILVNHLLEPPDRITGITRYLFSLLGELTRRRNFRYVLATCWSEAALPESVKAHGLEVETRPFLSSMPRNILQQVALLPRLRKKMGAAAEFNANPVGCFLGNWPRIVTVHDLYMRTLPDQYIARHRLWWNLFFPPTARSAQTLICVSQVTRSDVLRHYPELAGKATVVHEAGALDRTLPARPLSDAPYGLFVGNVSPNKNIGLLLDALNILEVREQSVPIFLAGGDGAGILAQAIRRRPLHNPPHLLGAISDERLSNAYAGAAFLVTTSKREGFCLPVLEAQERSVPVICPDTPIFREVAGNGALFFEPENPLSLAEGILCLMRNEDRRHQLALAAAQNASRFSWSRAAEETESVFEQAIREYSS